MKKIIILTLLILLSGLVYSQTAFCVRFKLKVHLTDNKTVIGEYFYYGLDYPNPNPDTLTFDNLLTSIHSANSSNNGEKKLILYKQVGILENPKCFETNLYYCLQENIIEIKISQIKSGEIISRNGCHPEIKTDNKYIVGCPPEIITELTKDEILMLNGKPNIEFHLTEPNTKYFNSFCEPIFISYGNLGEKKILEILEKYLLELNLLGNENVFLTDNQYITLKENLRKQKVIMIKTYYYN